MMLSGAEQFLTFLSVLKKEGVITDHEIECALESLDGLEGVLTEEYFIFGYEELGWHMSKNNSIEQLKKFALQNHDLLLAHKGPRYFFVQALVDNEAFSRVEVDELIACMPDSQQVFLKKRFG